VASVVSSVLRDTWTIADVLEHLGGIPLSRARAVPPPGTATEKDVLEAESRWGCICELVDGVLVEKTTGYYESLVAMLLGRLLGDFVEKHGLGVVLGEAGTLRILPTQVRIPDLCVIRWERFPRSANCSPAQKARDRLLVDRSGGMMPGFSQASYVQ